MRPKLLPASQHPNLSIRQLAPAEGEVPARLLFTITNATVQSHHGNILTREGHLLTGIHHPLRSPSDTLKTLSNLPTRTIPGRSLLLTSPSAWKNYAHWLLDTLPPVRHLDLSPYDHILAPSARPFHQEACKALGITPHRLLTLDANSSYQCHHLEVANTFPPGILSSGDAQWLKSKFPPSSPTTPQNRLYLSRGSAWRRRILNESELLQSLQQLNFSVIDTGQLSIQEQSSALHRASLVLAPHGAALANLIFAPSQTTVIELFPSNYLRTNYQSLTKTLGQNYHAHISPNPPTAPDYSIDSQPLLDLINRHL